MTTYVVSKWMRPIIFLQIIQVEIYYKQIQFLLHIIKGYNLR